MARTLRLLLPAVLVPALLLAPALSRAVGPVNLVTQHYGSTAVDVGLGAATDAAGNTYVTGYIGGTATFGGGNLNGFGGNDVFIAKYDKNGAHVWSKNFGSVGNDQGNAIAVDNAGNVYVTGSFTNTVNFGGANLVSAGGADIFVAKYSATGFHQWSARYGSTGTDSGNGIALDASGNVIVTGSYGLTVDFGGGGVTSAGSSDIFLVKFTSAGAHVWTKSFGSTGVDTGYGVATDASSNVILTGSFNGTVNFGGLGLVSAGIGDIVLAKFNSSGVHQWSQRFGNTSDDAGLAVATDGASNVVMTGYSRGSLTIGTDNFTSLGDADFLIAKFNSAGTYQWAKLETSAGLDAGYGIATDGAGNVYATGTAGGPMTIVGNDTSDPGFGNRDICLVKYNAAGVYQWSMVAGSSLDDNGLGIAVDPARHVHLTGYYSGGTDVGGGPMTSVGQFDFFFAHYSGGSAVPSIERVVDIGNDQGRKVRIEFARTGHDDALASSPVTQYEAYRRDAPPPSLTATPGVPSSRRVVPGPSLTPGQLLAGGWTQAGTVAAHAEDRYSIDVPTIGDSTIALGQYLSVFYIRAATATPSLFYDSPADSGYSVDNLAPAVPQNFVFSAGQLTWNQSSAEDFDYFTVYGSNSNSFGAATVVDYSVAPALNVIASPYVFYYVTATDFSGNEGKPAKVNTLSGVGGTPKSYVLSVSNYPNPFNPRTTVSYTVPSRGPVTITVYDAHGARVATLLDHADRAAGAYSMEWDGRSASGAVAASGVYFARIEHSSGTRTKKMVLLK